LKVSLASAGQAQKLPDFNILCEKCAFEGMTRFEDRFKQPLGISVNFTSYAARLLTQARNYCLACRMTHVLTSQGNAADALHVRARARRIASVLFSVQSVLFCTASATTNTSILSLVLLQYPGHAHCRWRTTRGS